MTDQPTDQSDLRDTKRDRLSERGWQAVRTREAREVLDQVPAADRLPLVTLVTEPGTTPDQALAMLRQVAAMTASDRRRVLTLASSEHARDRALAKRLATEGSLLPDPRRALLDEAIRAVRKAILAFPNDAAVPALTAVVEDLVAIEAEITAHPPTHRTT
jgi:hypothetical protein